MKTQTSIMCDAIVKRGSLKDNLWPQRECSDHTHEGLNDRVPAEVWIIGGCRHEHVRRFPFCTSCAGGILNTDFTCAECRHCEEPHECAVSVKYDAEIHQ